MGGRRAYTAGRPRPALGADMADIFSQKAHQRGFLRRKIKFLRSVGKQHLEEGLPRLFVLGRDLIVIRLPQQSIARLRPWSDLQCIQQKTPACAFRRSGGRCTKLGRINSRHSRFPQRALTVEQIVKQAGCKGNTRAHRNGNAVGAAVSSNSGAYSPGRYTIARSSADMLSAAPKQIAENMVTLSQRRGGEPTKAALSGQWIVSDVAISHGLRTTSPRRIDGNDGQPRAVFGKRIHQLPLNSLGR